MTITETISSSKSLTFMACQEVCTKTTLPTFIVKLNYCLLLKLVYYNVVFTSSVSANI